MTIFGLQLLFPLIILVAIYSYSYWELHYSFLFLLMYYSMIIWLSPNFIIFFLSCFYEVSLSIIFIIPSHMSSNFMVMPCINNIQHFNFQLMHTTLKNVELLKHFKTSKTAPTCFGLQGNHHQGATASTVHTPHRSQYAAITLTKSCVSSTYQLWTKCVIFS